MISLLTAIIGNTLSTFVSNSLKSIMNSNVLHTKTFREVISSTSKIIVLLIISSILTASLILLFCFGFTYFLLNSGLTFYQSIAIIIVIKVAIISLCVMKMKCIIKQINISGQDLNEIDQSDDAHKPGIMKNTINSFIEGFNSKK